MCGYDVIEAVRVDAYDEGGEYAENYLDDVTKEQREELKNSLTLYSMPGLKNMIFIRISTQYRHMKPINT